MKETFVFPDVLESIKIDVFIFKQKNILAFIYLMIAKE